MPTRNQSHDGELRRRRDRRLSKSQLRDVVLTHSNGFTEGGLRPEEIHEAPDFDSPEARVDVDYHHQTARPKYFGKKPGQNNQYKG